jgi:glycosyltransferase involved in cell wall biosynthesis
VIITFVGRLIAVKGVDLLIKAVKDIKHKINVLIVGDGPERENLENMIKNLGLNRKVIFAGWRTDIPAILRATDIFVLPSYSEGLPIALLEAMAAGKACVVTDIGLPVKNGENAIVIKPGNVAELKEALEYLIENKELREKLGKNAKNEASKFSWNKAAKKYYILLKNFL